MTTQNKPDNDTECPTCGKTDFKNQHGMKIHHAQAHDECIGKTETECEWCGETEQVYDYEVERNENCFCSKSCADAWMSDNFEKRPLTEAEREKIREANRGRELSEEVKEKIREANEGRTMPESAVEKMRESLTGRSLSEEHKEKLSEANAGKVPPNAGEELPLEWRENISEALEGHEFWGNEERSESVKKKISDTLKGREFSEETRQRMSEARKGTKPGQASNIEVAETGNHVRSTWEEEIDIMLSKSELEYEHEPRTFQFANGRGYTPDFIVEEDGIIEVKGRIWGTWDIRRAELFMEEFPHTYIAVGNSDIPHDVHIPWEERSELVQTLTEVLGLED